MPRAPRRVPGGLIYHVLNRSVGRKPIFDDGGDFAAFVRVLEQGVKDQAIRLLGWCVMSNHWHLVLWPDADGQLSQFMRWLTTTHARRWHEHRHSTGQGHLYQGRFKSFPVEHDAHLLTVLRYVERNPLRAAMVQRAEYWPYSSLRRRQGICDDGPLLTASPVPCREDWLAWVNEPQTDKEMEGLRASVIRSRPFGSPAWQARYATMLGLESTLRRRGRQRKARVLD